MPDAAPRSGNGKLLNKPFLKPSEVCQLVGVQPYVLRTWEAEFPHLGPRTHAGQRVYRRKDVDTFVKIRTLLFDEGLTMAGAKRRLEEERATASGSEAVEPAPADLPADARGRVARVREELRALLKRLA